MVIFLSIYFFEVFQSIKTFNDLKNIYDYLKDLQEITQKKMLCTGKL